MSQETIPSDQITRNMAEDPWGSDESAPRKSRSRRPTPIGEARSRRGTGGSGGGPDGSDFEDLAKNAANQAGDVARRLGSGGAAFILIGLLGLYAATGLYQVSETERMVETTFGRFAGVGEPGLNWHWPTPIGKRHRVDVAQRTTEIGGSQVASNSGGFSSRGSLRRSSAPAENLIVTGDKQLVSFPIKIVWQVDAEVPQIYQFAYGNPDKVIELAAETALRDNIGRTPALDAIGARAGQIRGQISADLRDLISANEIPLGVRILRVDAAGTPQVPAGVQESVRQIQEAQATALVTLETAQQRENKVLNQAQGIAGSTLSGARQDLVRRLNSGLGEANRLRQIYNGYRLSPETTLQRLYEDARRILLTQARIDATAEELRLDQILSNLTAGGSR